MTDGERGSVPPFHDNEGALNVRGAFCRSSGSVPRPAPAGSTNLFSPESDMKTWLTLLLCLLLGVQSAWAAAENRLNFDELYSGGGALGLRFSDKVRSFEGSRVTIRGFMAPPLKADADFFVLTREPVALCPFCSSDSDWPDNILVVYLSEKQRFVQNNAVIEVEGELEVGSWTDEHTGFVSQMRLRNATFHTL